MKRELKEAYPVVQSPAIERGYRPLPNEEGTERQGIAAIIGHACGVTDHFPMKRELKDHFVFANEGGEVGLQTTSQ